MADKLTSAVAVKMTDALHADGCASADGRRCNCAEVLMTALASPPTSTASDLPPSLRAALLLSILVTTAAWWLA